MDGCDTVTEAVVVAVAEAENTSPVELPPLYDVVETDALDRLFAATADDGSGPVIELCFYYSDSIVTVKGDGTVDVAPRKPTIEATVARSESE